MTFLLIYVYCLYYTFGHGITTNNTSNRIPFIEAIVVVSVVVDTVISAGIVNDDVTDDDVSARSDCTLAFFEGVRLLEEFLKIKQTIISRCLF